MVRQKMTHELNPKRQKPWLAAQHKFEVSNPEVLQTQAQDQLHLWMSCLASLGLSSFYCLFYKMETHIK